ncbi:MAG: hypothetical protein HY303_17640 [Candidatus Wallbacteria bacterium]|nr:hypothetical protein [Candidatus Wallbacteria bacterium]
MNWLKLKTTPPSTQLASASRLQQRLDLVEQLSTSQPASTAAAVHSEMRQALRNVKLSFRRIAARMRTLGSPSDQTEPVPVLLPPKTVK